MSADRELLISVPLLIRTFQNGATLCAPLRAPKLASTGDPASIEAEMRLFLGEHLARLPGDELARYALADNLRTLEVPALVPRDDLPRRLQVKTKLPFTAILIPENEDHWVVVPSLNHTFFVSRREPLEAAIEEEVKRVGSIHQEGDFGYFDLLPAKADRLVRMEVSVERTERSPQGRSAKLRKELSEKKRKEEALEVLHSIADPLHKLAGDGPPLVGREEALASLDALLSAKSRSSLILVGEELVGKSALMTGWLGQNRERKMVFATSGAQLIAGMSGLGQWQARLERVLKAAELLDAVLFFDNLSDLFTERERSSVNLSAAIKPYLEDGKVRMVGELTPSALDLLESKHLGFFSCFHRVRLEPLSKQLTLSALEQRVKHDRSAGAEVTLGSQALPTLIDLVDRYLPYQPYPGKAARFFEELKSTAPSDLKTVGSDRVLDVFSTRTGIPAFLLRADRALQKSQIIERFEKRLIGQKEPIRRVAETICVVKAGLQPSAKPLSTFLFVGPTGVGKTELARTLAEFLFGSERRMVRFDMSEYSDPLAAERLIRGHQAGQEGLLTRRVRQQPFSVVLLDEIEKADPAVFDLLLQVAGEGRLTDARGRTTHFHNTIIIMTSNLGARDRNRQLGIDTRERSGHAHYLETAQRSFRPEFINRIDRIIAFDELTPAQVHAVAQLSLAKLIKRRGFAERSISLEVSEDALARLALAGYSKTYGARALRRHLEDHLMAPCAGLLSAAGEEAHSATVRVDIEDSQSRPKPGALLSGGLCFELHLRSSPRAQLSSTFVERISDLRRYSERALELEPVEQLKEQLLYLRAQLATGDSQDPDGDERRSGREQVELQREHHRLNEVWKEGERLSQDILAAEELSLTAFFESESPKEYLQDAQESHDKFRRQLVYLILAKDYRYDEITLVAQELDEGRSLNLWLAPLLRALPSRDISLTLHEAHESYNPSDSWPVGRRWGRPKTPEAFVDRLEADRKDPLCVMLRLVGPYAGSLLSLEQGRHLYKSAHAKIDPVGLIIRKAASRTHFTDAEWLALEPPPAPSKAERLRHRVVRDFDLAQERLTLLGGDLSLSMSKDEYWPQFERIALEQLLYGLREDLDLDRLFEIEEEREDPS